MRMPFIRTLRDSFSRGFLLGLLALAPLLSAAFLLEDELGLLGAGAFCPQSITLRRSDAELRLAARAIEKGRCTLVFASSEGSGSAASASLHQLAAKPGLTWVRDYEGFAALRALAYLRRTHTHPARIIVIVNHHYARSANRPMPDLGETWFAEAFAQARLKNPGVLQLYLRPRPASRVGPLRELFSRITRPLRAFSLAQSPQDRAAVPRTPDAQPADTIGDLKNTPFAVALEELCKENGAEIVLFPLNEKLERSLGLDPAEQMARIKKAAAVCRRAMNLEQGEAFFVDRIHWSEEGRRAMARTITDSSLSSGNSDTPPEAPEVRPQS